MKRTSLMVGARDSIRDCAGGSRAAMVREVQNAALFLRDPLCDVMDSTSGRTIQRKQLERT